MLNILITLLRSLSAIASDPALGYRGSAIKGVLDLAASLVERGAEGADQLKALAEQVRTMADEDREPTKEEWLALQVRSDEAHRTIQEWRE